MSHHVFENQYKKTKERAEMFASSLYKAREQEELFEEERQKWVDSFEEKSVIIEQLERELTSTVDALNQEKRERTVLQKELVHTTWDNSQYVNLRDLKLNPETSTERNDKMNSRQNYPLPARPNFRHEQGEEVEKSGRRVLELLQQSQDETNRAKKEIVSIRLERDHLLEQILIIKRQTERDFDEKEKLLQSLRTRESEVMLCNHQITDYQLDKGVYFRKEGELLALVASLEKQIATQRSDLIKAASDLDTAAVYRTSLENKIDVLNQTVIDQTDRARIPSLQERFEEMEIIVIELARRAESAETSLSLLIDSGTKEHEVLEGRIMPSESAPPHPSTAAPTHQIGDFNSDYNGLAQSQRYRSNTTRSKVEFNVFPPDGPEGISTESCDKDSALSEFYRSINTRQAYTENLSANRNEAEFMSPHEGVGHRRVTGKDNGVTKKSPAVRKLVKATSKSKSVGSAITASKVKICPHKIDSRGKDCNASRTAIELTPRTISQSRNVSLGSDYGNYIREVKSALPNNSMEKCVPSVLREKNRPLGHKSRSVPRFESSPSPSMDTQRQRNSNATRNLVETRKPSTKHYDLGRGDGAPMINFATFHPRQASPYRSRSAAPSTVLERYISTPIMKSSARGAATTPSVIERAGRHKLQVTIPSGYASFPFRV